MSITTDKLRSYPEAMNGFKCIGQLSLSTKHRTSKYSNNIIEADRGLNLLATSTDRGQKLMQQSAKSRMDTLR